MAREMKDSGIEWIGEIPVNWGVTKVLNGLSMPITDGPHTTPDLYDEGVAFVSAEAVSCGNGRIDFSHIRGYISEEFYHECCRKYIPAVNDIYMIKSGATTGRVAIVDTLEPVFTIWSPLAVFRCNEDIISPKYLYYQLQSDGFQKQVELGWTYGTQQNIGMRSLEKLIITIPPIDEQHRIATFLDTECSRIDAVIAQIRASIEEYKKLKQSVITQAVTKGIRLGRKMKDSGIEWIGEIPEEWITPKVLQCLQMPITDGPHTTPELFDDGIPFISAEAVSTGNGHINFEHMRGYISQDFYEECCKKYIPQIDDVYMIKSGATTGRIAIVDTDRVFTIWSPLAVFRADRKRVLPVLLFYCLQADYVQKQIENGWTYGTQQNIGMRTLEKMKLCVPPIDEQGEIISFLDDKISRVTQLIEKKEILLVELENYKKSLIYEYVTGKKEVPI